MLSSIVISSLRKTFPSATIDFLTETPAKGVLEGNPDLNSVIVFSSKKQSGLSLILDVKKRNYDLVLDLFGNPRSALVTYFSGAKYKVGYRLGWREYCYNILAQTRGGEVHNTQFNLDALRACDIPIVEPYVRFPLTEQSELFASRFFDEHNLNGDYVVALNATGGWYTKRWGLQQYAKLADSIAEKYKAKILLLWGPGERDDAERIAALATTATLLIPQTSLKELASLLKRCSMMVTNDSGPMHIAASVGTPTVAIFGPTNPDLQGPYGNESEIVRNTSLGCLGCNYTKCPIGNPCMEELTVNDVLKAFEKLERKLYILHHPDLSGIG